ncbi:MAG: outer membrane lipoprotein carrier protein LolA [Cyclobacteriaceae bacterium]|nr:outer membrane lipoprotein carrier protein LolA [Cyclobacteriaceae bacterium]MCH8515249.1 outer membrane lipoprotein carrier protein LolA [Cyclobacteriaceae bacterium]
MRTTLLVFAIMTLSIFTVTAQSDSKSKAILDKMSEYYKNKGSFKAEFTYQLNNPQENISEEFKGKIAVKGDKYRVDIAGQEIITDTKTQWTFMKELNEVNIDNYYADEDDLSPSQIFDAYKTGFQYNYMEEKTEGSTKYHIIDLTPDDKSLNFFKIRMKIDQKNNTLHSWVIFDKNGSKYTYTIDKFDGSLNLADSYFKFDPSKHSGIEIVDLR